MEIDVSILGPIGAARRSVSVPARDRTESSCAGAGGAGCCCRRWPRPLGAGAPTCSSHAAGRRVSRATRGATPGPTCGSSGPTASAALPPERHAYTFRLRPPRHRPRPSIAARRRSDGDAVWGGVLGAANRLADSARRRSGLRPPASTTSGSTTTSCPTRRPARSQARGLDDPRSDAAMTSGRAWGTWSSANTLAKPGLAAKMATTLDHVSGGRDDPGPRRRLVRPRARGVRVRLRDGLRRAAGPAWRGRAAVRRLLDGETVTTRAASTGSRRCLRPAARPGRASPSSSAAPARRRPSAGRPVRRPVERLRLARGARGVRRDPAGGMRRVGPDDARSSGRSTSSRHPPDHAEADGPGRADGRAPAHEARTGSTPPARSTRSLVPPSLAEGFQHPVMIFRTPFDLETIERLPDLRAALA